MESNQISASSVKLIRKLLLPKNSLNVSHHPTVYTMAGIPGSGKTTFVNKMLSQGEFPQNAFILNPDNIMEALPEYQDEVLSSGKIKAFELYEVPARELAYQLLEDVIEINADIIIDMGSARLENYELLKRLKKLGYYVKMYWIDISIEEALARIKLRNRYTPDSMIIERYVMLGKLQDNYRCIADEFYKV